MSDETKLPARPTDAIEPTPDASDEALDPEQHAQPAVEDPVPGDERPDTAEADTTDMNAVGDDGQVFGG